MTGDSGELLEDLPIPDAAPLRRRFCCRCGFMRRWKRAAARGRWRSCARRTMPIAGCVVRAGQPPYAVGLPGGPGRVFWASC